MMLQINGMRSSAYFLSWALVYFAVVSISVMIVTALVLAGSLFAHTNVLAIFILLECYALSLIAFGFIVAACMNTDKPAGLVNLFHCLFSEIFVSSIVVE